MALNKSNNKTPSSRSGFFTELTASVGKQSQFLFPVRIKATPNQTAPLSEGKKNNRMIKPVLIKDLFPSSKKDRRNTIAISATTQKKRGFDTSSTQPFLNTQSCYKPKEEVKTQTFFNRKSNETSKVRRQLYQSPTKIFDESKKNTTRIVQKKEKKNVERPRQTRNFNFHNKENESYLLPPNSIKNDYLRKSGSKFKPPLQQNINQKKNSKNTKNKHQQSKFTGTEDISGINETSFPEDSSRETSYLMKDVSTMTSPSRLITSFKSLTNLNEYNRPSVIMSSSNVNTSGFQEVKKNIHSIDSTRTNISSQNLNFDFKSITDFDISNLIDMKTFLNQTLEACNDQARKLKESLQACENQAFNLKQVLFFVENIIGNRTIEATELLDGKALNKTQTNTILIPEKNITTSNEMENSNTKNFSENNSTEITTLITEKVCESEKKVPKILISHEDTNNDYNEKLHESLLKLPDLSTIGEVSCESFETRKSDLPSIEISENLTNVIHQAETWECLNEPVKIKNLENEPSIHCGSQETNDNQILCSVNRSDKISTESKERSNTSLNIMLHDNSALNISSSDNSENKENLNISTQTVAQNSLKKIQKIQGQQLVLFDNTDLQNLQRSTKLSEKCSSVDSLSNSLRDDSFTLLENELNVKHEMPPPQAKSMPSSPSKPPMTPGGVRQWDKRVQRPLKEYMALKMNGTFLVTPDAKRFQSVLEPTDTPHSRKSLSRKIFMELCDLYAESPEHN